MSVNVGVVGATGVVGETFLKLMHQRKFPVNELRLFASKKSAGQKRDFAGREVFCGTLEEDAFNGLDVVFFSSGDDISKVWAPKAVAAGAFAVDNSAAFRMSDDVKLVVPEINGKLLPNRESQAEIIANPNCSTIQLVMALAPLAVEFGISKVMVSTYQSVSGAGKEGQKELSSQSEQLLKNPGAKLTPSTFPYQMAYNSIPQIGSFDAHGFSSEENKIMNETRKIMGMPSLPVSAFTVRVPTLNGHGEAVWVTLDQEADLPALEKALSNFPGLKYVPHQRDFDYPTLLDADGEDEVYVGRLHKDPNDKTTYIMWVVADNLLKGAALNGIQIAERIFNTR